MSARLWSIVGLAAALASPVRADESADAKKLFEGGNRLFEQGHFRDAAVEYGRAYQAQPLPDFVFNAASAYDKGGAREEAIAAYRRYLGLPQHDGKDDPSIKARIEVLERELAMLMQSAPKHTPLPFVEASTRHAFPTWTSIGGKDYLLVGAGARTVFGIKVYGMALYVEDEGARMAFPKLVARAGGADVPTLSRADQAQQFLMLGEFGKHALLHFERAVPAAKLRDAYRDTLSDDVGAKATAELRRDTEAFIALFDRDVKAGGEIHIHTDGDGMIFVRIEGGMTRTGPKNPRLAHDIWASWLGTSPVSSDLKQRLVERIDALGR